MKRVQRPGDAGCEPDIESSLEITTFQVLEELLQTMGIRSKFLRGKSDSSVILEPDYIWKFWSNDERGSFRLPIEVKPFWSFPQNVNLADRYASDMTELKRDSVTIRAVNQTYGYSSFNYTRYAALTTQHELHCFKRNGDSSGESSLVISNPIPLGGFKHLDFSITYFASWLFLIWNSREDGIYSSPSGTPLKAMFDGGTSLPLKQVGSPIQKLYSLREINADQIHFEEKLIIRKGAVGTVVSGQLLGTPLIKFKMYDTYHDPDYLQVSEGEVSTYKVLRDLQGSVIPRFYGYFNYHGIIILALEDCGEPVSESEYGLFQKTIERCVAALRSLGVDHRDLELRDGVYPNILKKGDEIRIIDFHLK